MLQLLQRGNLDMKIIVGSDHGGFSLKTIIAAHLEQQGIAVEDVGCYSEDSCDYPVIAKEVAKKVLLEAGRGILVCGTGIGMSIAANKFKGIRASLCSDTYSARMTRKHNDSNVLCLGERVIGPGLALDIVDEWLVTDFEGGRHERRVNMLELEE